MAKHPGGSHLASIRIGDVDSELGLLLRSTYDRAQLETNHVEKAKCFYKIQTFRKLGDANDRRNISVCVDKSVKTYKGHIDEALEDINIAAPGINLFKIKKDDANITIFEGENTECYTVGTFEASAKIQLDTNWDDDWKGQTTIHELLHALGFQHEFKRKDAKTYVKINTNDSQYRDPTDHDRIRGLTRFDPFSVMMYPENDDMERLENGDRVWKLKSGILPNKKMSELDKVALNMVFRPCSGNGYNPELGPITGMFYCERDVMRGNQQIGPTDTDGRCGPNNWANCPACRVLKGSKKCQKMYEKGKWQGWSGLFYCGKHFTKPKEYYRNGEYMKHDGVCGPNNGPPCNKCGLELYQTYDYDKEVE